MARKKKLTLADLDFSNPNNRPSWADALVPDPEEVEERNRRMLEEDRRRHQEREALASQMPEDEPVGLETVVAPNTRRVLTGIGGGVEIPSRQDRSSINPAEMEEPSELQLLGFLTPEEIDGRAPRPSLDQLRARHDEQLQAAYEAAGGGRGLGERLLAAGSAVIEGGLGTRASAAAGRALRELESLDEQPLAYFLTDREIETGRRPSDEVLERRRADAIADAQDRYTSNVAREGQRQAAAQESLATVGTATPLAFAAELGGSLLGQGEELVLPTVGGIAGGRVGGTAGSVIGSAIGSLPMVRSSLGSNYRQIREMGGTEEEAEAYAQLQTAIEFGPAVLGGVGSSAIVNSMRRLGVNELTPASLQAAVSRITSNRAARIGGAGVVEGTDELIAGEGQRFADRILRDNEFFSSEDTREQFAEGIAEEERNVGRTRAMEFLAGASAGTTLAAAPVQMDHVRRQRELDNIQNLVTEFIADPARQTKDAIEIHNETVAKLREQDAVREAEEQASRRAQEEDAAWEQREQEAQARREAEEEAAFRQLEQEQQEAGTTATIDRERPTPESVAQERAETDRGSLVQAVDEARQNVEILEDAVEAGDTSSQTLNNLARAQREQINAEEALTAYDEQAAEQEAERQRQEAEEQSRYEERARELAAIREEEIAEEAARPERERQERVEQGRRIEELRKERERLHKEQEDRTKKEREKEQKAQDSRRRRIARDVLSNNPDISLAEADAIVQRRMADPEDMAAPARKRATKKAAKKSVTPEQRLERKINSVLGRVQSARNAATESRLNAAVQAYFSQNPDATREQALQDLGPTLETIYPQEQREADRAAEQEAPVVPERAEQAQPIQEETPLPIDKQAKDLTDEDVDNIGSYFSRMAAVEGEVPLGMAGETEAVDVPFDLETFEAQARDIAKAIRDNWDPNSASLVSMITQGKLRVVPNANSIGRQTNNVAEYAPSEGTMYLFADRLEDPSDIVSIIARAFHEATHAGQYNDREGRSDLFRHFLGDRRTSEAAARIRRAADNGNRLAQNAVVQATVDSSARGSDVHEDSEVVAYFASEVVESRRGVLGTAAGIVNDIVTAGRNFLRENLGMDIQFDIGDFATAAANVGQEIAQTDVQGSARNTDSLGMIYSEDAVSPERFQEALAAGRVYDSEDGRRKFVLSDEGAWLSPNAVDDLIDTGYAVLRDLMPHHDVLYDNVPSARNVDVYVSDDVEEGTGGYYSLGASEIVISRDVAEGYSELSLHEALMHEIQHYIQDVGGYLDDGRYRETPVSEDIKVRADAAVDALHKAARNYLDVVPSQMLADSVGPTRRRVSDILYDTELHDSAKAFRINELMEDVYDGDIPSNILPAVVDYLNARAESVEANTEWNKVLDQQHADYLSNYTEREAFRTQADSLMTQEELDARGNPEPIMREQTSEEEPATAGRFDVPDIARVSPEPVLGMSDLAGAVEPYTPESQRNFRNWFGNSQIVDSQGNPKVMYHGSPQNFTTFQTNYGGMIFVTPERMFAEAFAGMDPAGNQREAMPLYVRAENVWDYENPEHLEALLNYPGVRERFMSYYGDNIEDGTITEEGVIERVRMGDWGLIELPVSVDAIMEMGHDALTVFEGGHKNLAVFDPNQLKHAEENSGQWSREDDSILGMSDFTRKSNDVINSLPLPQQAIDNVHRAKAVATGLFRNDHGLGRQVLIAYENAKSMPAAEQARASASIGNYNRALTQLAEQEGTTFAALNDQIMKELDALDKKGDSYEQNRKAWKDVLDKYGSAGRHLMDMRDQIDAMSKDMLLWYYNSGVRLSPSEAKKFTTIANNLGRYTHRMYAAHFGNVGRSYAQEMMKSYKRSKQGKDLTPAQEKAAQTVQEAIKVIVDNHLRIPDDIGLWQMNAESVRRMYDTWGTRPNAGLSVDDMRIELSEKRDSINGDQGRIDRQADQVVRDLLGLLDDKNVTAIGKYYRGGKLNTGILQDRAKIPLEIRALMGEITDPGMRMLATVTKQAEFVARTKMFHELMNKADPRDLQPPDATGTEIVVSNNMTRLEGESFGPLQGWYASPNMQALLSDVRESLMTMEQAALLSGTNPSGLAQATFRKALDLYMGGAATSKAMQILGNAFLYPLNFAGSWMMLAANGNYNPATWRAGLDNAIDLISYARNPEHGLRSADLVTRYGITDNAAINELRSIPHQKVQRFVAEMAGKNPTIQTAKEAWNKLKFTAAEIYAMMDVWSKMANFHHEVNQLREYHELNGDNISDHDLYSEAADAVKATNISWARAAPLIKAIERGGITHFGTYFYEVFRSQIHNAARGIYETTTMAKNAKTPEARNKIIRRGLNRLAGQGAVWTMVHQFTQFANGLIFGEDDEEAWALRSLMAEFVEEQDFWPVGVGKDGNPVYFAISRIDPYGPMTDMYRRALVGDFDFNDAMQEFADLYVKPRMAPQLYTAARATFGSVDDPDAVSYRRPLVKQLYPNGYGAVAHTLGELGVRDNTVNAWTNAIETMWFPGTATAYRDTNVDIEGPLADNFPSKFTYQIANASRYMGGTFYQLNPDRAAQHYFRQYNDKVRGNQRAVRQMLDNNPDLSSDAVLSRVLPLIEDEKKEWDKLQRLYRGMRASGMTEDQIDSVFKDRIGDKRTRSQLWNNEFESLSINKRSLETTKQNELKGKTDEEREEILDKWDVIMDTIYDVEEMIR